MTHITRRSTIKSKTILLIDGDASHNIVCNCKGVADDARKFSVDAGYRNYGQLADELTDGDVKALVASFAPCAREALSL